MTLQSLPSEIVELIAQHLSVEDILACCATCSSMRNVFNDDFIWKRKCNLEVIDYLKSTECLVEPSVDWLEVTDDELCPLSPLPTWRKCYMMQTRLYRNWREGRYKKEEVDYETNTEFYSFTSAMFYKNDYLFLFPDNIFEEEIERRDTSEVWNVKESPFFHSYFYFNSSDFFEIENHIARQFYKIVDDKIIVSKENLVLIYNICLPNSSSFHLDKAFLFDLSEDESRLLVTRARAEPEFYLCEETSAEVFVCGHFLIGRLENNFTLHIWNILSGEKVTEENCPENSNMTYMTCICTDEKNKTVIIKLYLEGVKYRFHYKAYDLSKMEFSSFDIKHDCDVLVLNNNILIGADLNQLFSYDYETSRSLADRKFNHQILPETVTFVGNNLLCGTSDSTVFVMNSSLNVLSSHKLTFDFYGLKTICNRFVIVMNSVAPEVWEIGKSAEQLVKFPIESRFAGTNEHCSKIAIENSNKIIILNFW